MCMCVIHATGECVLCKFFNLVWMLSYDIKAVSMQICSGLIQVFSIVKNSVLLCIVSVSFALTERLMSSLITRLSLK
jgi:hypothetical protein